MNTTCQAEESSMFRLNALHSHRIQSYARQSGKTAQAVFDQALDYWFENFGEAVLEEMVKRNSRKRVSNR